MIVSKAGLGLPFAAEQQRMIHTTIKGHSAVLTQVQFRFRCVGKPESIYLTSLGWLAVLITASNAGLGCQLPSNNNGLPLRRQ